MEFIIEIINTYGVKLLAMIVYIIFGVVAMAVKKLTARYVDTDIKQNLAKTAVQAVEQMYKDIHGEEKLNKAMEYLSNALNAHDIKIGTEEMKLLLEAAVGEFNRVFQKEE